MIIASVLNLGNLTFKKSLSKNNEEMAIVVNKDYLKNAAELLMLDYKGLEKCFEVKTRKVGPTVYESPLKYHEAIRPTRASVIYPCCS